MPGMAVTQPVGHFPELGHFSFRNGWWHLGEALFLPGALKESWKQLWGLFWR